MNDQRRRQWINFGCRVCVFVGVIGLLVILLFGSMICVVTEKANQSLATSNCRQIIMAIKYYAEDHEGRYPTGGTANEAFRKLIEAEILQDERIFVGLLSPFVPNGDIGTAPDYMGTVGRGENHWMLVDGLTYQPSGAPLVYENALDTSWPPVWDGSRYRGVRKRGQTWGGGKIIVGYNDGAVKVEKLSGKDKLRLSFDPAAWQAITETIPQARVLDIEE